MLQPVMLIHKLMAVDQFFRSVNEYLLQMGDGGEITIKLLKEGCYLGLKFPNVNVFLKEAINLRR